MILTLSPHQLEPEPEEAPADVLSEDMGDVTRRTEEERAAAEAAEHERRSSALKRDPPLPRPLVVDEDLVAGVMEEGEGAIATASALIRAEMAELLKHDLVKYPVRFRLCTQ